MKKALIFLNKNKGIFVALFFMFWVLIGIFTYKDYGLSWDEPLSHNNGQVALSYIKEGDQSLWTYSERYYGTIFESSLGVVADFFGATTTQEVFFIRHLSSYFLFVVGAFFFYLLCKERFKSWGLALLATTFLFLSPRIFPEAFYNSKDIPVLVFFIISFYTLQKFLQKPSWKIALWHALPSALGVAIRMPALFIPFLTFGIWSLQLFLLKEIRIDWKKILTLLGIYMVAFIILLILFWPFLWKNPGAHFVEAFQDMSRFSRQLTMQVFYKGQFVSASNLPWHYIPTWILVTTPLLYIIFFFTGLISIFYKYKNSIKNEYQKNYFDIAVVAWFFVPLFSVVVLNSVLYDGWRHLYFIYPALIYVAVVGIMFLRSLQSRFGEDFNKAFPFILGGIIGIQIIMTGSFMLRSHPYQNVYFNRLSGGLERARSRFDLDYWGLSFRKGLEYIAANDTQAVIPVFIAGGTSENVYILSPENQARFQFVDQANVTNAKYILTNYRWQDVRKFPFKKAWYSVKVDGVEIMSILKV